MENLDAIAPVQRPDRRPVSVEFRKCYSRWLHEGLFEKYLSGQHVLDIGFRGGDPNAVPITEAAIGVELDYPDYDGTHLPFPDASQDAVFASAVFEHVPNYQEVLNEWYRVLKVGGYLVIFVPHRYLYEKQPDLPSSWNGDHRRLYTSMSLLREFEESLPINGFRVRHLLEDDEGYCYDDAQTSRPRGHYQIEIVVEKINRPSYSDNLEYPDYFRQIIDHFDRVVIESIIATIKNSTLDSPFSMIVSSTKYFTPWHKLAAYFIYSDPPELGGKRLTQDELRAIVRPYLDLVAVDEESYVDRYQELKNLREPALHWRIHGYFAGRLIHQL